MKGISDVIAIILILMITVALAALAYVWFTGIFETISSGAGQAATGAAKTIATNFKIEAAKGFATDEKVTITIRNTGTENIDASKIAVYVDDNIKETEGNTGTISPGDTLTFDAMNVANPCNKILKVTIETGAEDSITISC